MGRPRKWTDEQVEVEIARLTASEFVKLARKEKRIRNKRREYLSSLQWYEARGRELAAAGITWDNIEEKMFGELPEETEESE